MSARMLRHLLVGSVTLLAFHGSAFAAPAAAAPPSPPAASPPAAPVPPPQAPPPTAPAPLAESLTGMAKAEYGAARILYDDGDFAGALEKLRSAYDQSKDPRLLWNMAACHKNLRHYAEVVRLVDRYLSEGKGFVSESDRADATSLLDTVKGFITRVEVTSNEPGATVYIDEVSVGTTPLTSAVPVDMGPHKIRVSKAGFVDFVVSPELPGGQPFSVVARLVVERHEGKLRILADAKNVLHVDGKVVGTGLWEGVLKSGTHSVLITGDGKIAHRAEVVVSDNQLNSMHVSLEDRPAQVIKGGGVPAWVWVAGGVLVAGGGVGAYFLLKPQDAGYRAASEGNWGAISL